MSLRERSQEIDSLLKEECNEWKRKSAELDEKIKEQQEILASDAAKGDRSENATFQKATELIGIYVNDKQEIEGKINNFNLSFTECSYDNYEAKGYVTVGSTVLIELRETGKQYVVKIVPKLMDAPLKGAIALDCPAGRALMQKKAGDIALCRTERATWGFILKEVY